jgi:hypothetical protein
LIRSRQHLYIIKSTFHHLLSTGMLSSLKCHGCRRFSRENRLLLESSG